MIALLGTLVLGLVMGKLVRRMTAAVDLLLLLLVAALVMVEFTSWSGGNTATTGEQLRRLLDILR